MGFSTVKLRYYGAVSSLKTELTLLFMLKAHRNKIVIMILAVLSVFLFGTNAVHASSNPGKHRISYRTQLGQDLDGDHIPETATIRQCGYIYQVSIHFTTGRPKLRLTTYVTEGIAGLSFQTTDVNDDSRGDLVIISATSVRPIGIWLNQGKAKFKKVSSWSYGVGRYTGPEYRHAKTTQPEPISSILNDPLPQATPSVEYFSLDRDSTDLISPQPEQPLFDPLMRHVSLRGPPPRVRV